jgi:hypothetical protein
MQIETALRRLEDHIIGTDHQQIREHLSQAVAFREQQARHEQQICYLEKTNIRLEDIISKMFARIDLINSSLTWKIIGTNSAGVIIIALLQTMLSRNT